MSDLLTDIRNHINLWVWAGYDDDQQLIERAVYYWKSSWKGEFGPSTELRSHVEKVVAELLDEHRLDQTTWPEVTDCDRLDAAFAELDVRGILARQNYETTISSGCAAISAEIERELTVRPLKGYVFFHEQDTESAVIYDGPVLAWGAVYEGDDAWNAVAHEIMEVIEKHGLKCSWPGAENCRISVDGMVWRRRRTPRAPG